MNDMFKPDKKEFLNAYNECCELCVLNRNAKCKNVRYL